jgi:hypothetical protein
MLGGFVPMKIKLYSWFLAGAYLLCGVMVFFVLPYFLAMLPQGGIQDFRVFYRAVFSVGPLGWLLVALTIAAIVVLKDFWFHSRFLNPVFTAILVVLASGIIFAIAVVWYVCRVEVISASY